MIIYNIDIMIQYIYIYMSHKRQDRTVVTWGDETETWR